MADILAQGRTDPAATHPDEVNTATKQLYLVHMLCASCYHRFDEVTVYAGYHWHTCPKCGGYFAKRVWGSQVTTVDVPSS